MALAPAADALEWQIAYATDSGIYVLDDVGRSIRVTRHPSDIIPAWSPDGRQLVYSSHREGRTNLHIVDVITLDTTQLTDDPVEAIRAAWSPDGQTIAYSSPRAANGRYDVYAIDVDGTNERKLTDHDAHDIHPSWSPDGSMIAFRSQRTGEDQVFTMAADGEDVTQVTPPGGRYTDPAWSPDGLSILVDFGADGVSGVGILDLATGEVANATELPRLSVEFPKWSPDGTRIAFHSGGQGENPREVFFIENGQVSPSIVEGRDPVFRPVLGPLGIDVPGSLATTWSAVKRVGSASRHGVE
jgi:tol-pal system beta propeller repeat protein TolB